MPSNILPLPDVYETIYKLGVKSSEELKKNHPLVYDQLLNSVYEFLCSSGCEKGIYKAAAAYYTKVGNSNINSTVQAEFYNEKTKRIKYFEKKLDLKHGDLVHDYYLYLFTETKKKGKSKGDTFFTILFKDTPYQAWLATTIVSFRNWIFDKKTVAKVFESADKSLSSDSSDTSYTIESVSASNNDATISNISCPLKHGMVNLNSTPESACISKTIICEIINALANEFLVSHPEDFIVFSRILFNEHSSSKSSNLFEHFASVLKSNNLSVEEATCTIILEALDDLTSFGLEYPPDILSKIDSHRIINLLTRIQDTLSSNNISEKEKKDIMSTLSHWYEYSRRRFSKNATVLSFYPYEKKISH